MLSGKDNSGITRSRDMRNSHRPKRPQKREKNKTKIKYFSLGIYIHLYRPKTERRTKKSANLLKNRESLAEFTLLLNIKLL